MYLTFKSPLAILQTFERGPTTMHRHRVLVLARLGETKKLGDFKPFDDDNLYKFIGLMFANGLDPWSNFESWFTSLPSNHLLYASNIVSSVFDKKVHSVKYIGTIQ